ncbi:MAG: DUF350 domain-containing protein [Armatimonadota bacterium]
MAKMVRRGMQRGFLLGMLAWLPVAARAQGSAAPARPGLLEEFMSTLVFGVVGIVLAIVGFKLFDLVIKADIEKEIFENGNRAAAMLAGAVVLGVCLIVAMTIHS